MPPRPKRLRTKLRSSLKTQLNCYCQGGRNKSVQVDNKEFTSIMVLSHGNTKERGVFLNLQGCQSLVRVHLLRGPDHVFLRIIYFQSLKNFNHQHMILELSLLGYFSDLFHSYLAHRSDLKQLILQYRHFLKRKLHMIRQGGRNWGPRVSLGAPIFLDFMY